MNQVNSTRRVLVVSGVRGDTRRYRALHLVEQLRLLGTDVTYAHLMAPDFLARLCQEWDVIFFHRVAYQPYLRNALRQVKESRALLLSDFDDLIFDPEMIRYIDSPDFSDPVRRRLYTQTMLGFRTMLDMSDGMTASTDYLADQIHRSGRPVWVHRNAFSLKMVAAAEAAQASAASRSGGLIVIGYASGTPTHNRDFEMIRPALRSVMERYPHTILRLIGPLQPGRDWGSLSDRIQCKSLVPWLQLPEHLAGFDINLAPLVPDNPFSQSKSEIKFMEAALVKVPTVASRTDAFASAVRSGENGYLADCVQEWEEMLSRLIESADLRRQVGERAHEDVMAAYHPQVRAQQLAANLEEIYQMLRGGSFWTVNPPSAAEIEQRAQQAAAEGGWVPLQYDRGPSNVQMGLYSLRHTGLKRTLQQAWVFLRRLLAPVFPFRQL